MSSQKKPRFSHSGESSPESSSSGGTPKSGDENMDFKFQLSQEIYDMLLKNISPQLDEEENVVIEFDNQEVRKENDETKPNVLKETLNYMSLVRINPKKNTKKANLIYLEEGKNADSSMNSQYFEQISDISIAKIWIKSLDINIDLMTQAHHALKSLKSAALKNLESIYKESFSHYDLSVFKFVCKDIEITTQDEDLSLGLIISKYNLDEALVGNVFSIDMKMTDKKVEMDIMKTIFLKNKEPDERTRCLVKIEKSNNKLSNRILIIKEEEKDLTTAIITKMKGDEKTVFPLAGIKQMEKMPSVKDSNALELAEGIKIKVHFLDELNWSALVMWFLSESNYMQFLELYLEFSQNKIQNNNNSSNFHSGKEPNKKNRNVPKDDFLKVTNKANDQTSIAKKSMTIDDILSQTKDINLILDKLDENKHKHMEEEIKKIEEACRNEEYSEKSFNIKQKNMLRVKTDRVLKFTINFDMEILKNNNQTLLNTYPTGDIESVQLAEKGSKKIFVDFKNKKTKLIKFYLPSPEEALGFINYFYSTVLESYKRMKITESANKDFFKKDEKRYSWLCKQNATNYNKLRKDQLLNESKPKHIYFNVINKKKQMNMKQILHINFLNNIISFLKPNQDIAKQIDVTKVRSLANCYLDPRRVLMTIGKQSSLEKRKTIDLIFQDVKTKYIFYSAINSVLHPDVKDATKEKFKIYITTWNVGFSEPPDDLRADFLKNLEDVDIFAIGIQECKFNTWLQKLQGTLKFFHFTLMNVITMWRMMLCIFVKTHHINEIKNLEAVSRPTGIANIIGNKGGMLVSFWIHNTSFCFISCHLAAKPHNVDLRKSNYYDLITNLRTGVPEIESIFQFDYVFWFGDMNFRVDMPFDKVVDICEQKDYEAMWESDQLTKERNSNSIFSDFNEGLLDFRPTYRRMRNDDTWSNKKNQSPSWCDRILFRTKPGYFADLLEYGSREMQYGSDHRPVYAIVEVDLEKPYVGNPPLYLRKTIPDGIFKIKEINIEYDLKALIALTENVHLTIPCEITLFFSEDFLKKSPSSSSLKIEKMENCIKLNWKQEGIPILYSALSDFKFLKSKHILVSIIANDHINTDVLIGQCYLSLKELIENNGSQTSFDVPISLLGKIFGKIEGNMLYDIEHSEVFLT